MNENKKKLSFKDILILIFSVLIIAFQCIIMINQYTLDCNDYKDDVKTELVTQNHINYAQSSYDNAINPTNSYDFIYFNLSLSKSELTSYITQTHLYYQVENNGDQYYLYHSDNVSLYVTLGDGNEEINMYYRSGSNITNILINNEWQINNGCYEVLLSSGYDEMTIEGILYNVGDHNDIYSPFVSTTPFLFHGSNISTQWTSSGLENPNDVTSIYINTNLNYSAVKNILNTYVGDTAGTRICYWSDSGVLVNLNVINNNANAFIKLETSNYSEYIFIYDYVDTDEDIYWYGFNPRVFDSGGLVDSFTATQLGGFNIYELKSLFSRSNDFEVSSSDDSYENGYNKGFYDGANSILDNPNNHGLYTSEQYNNAFNDALESILNNLDDYDLYTKEQFDNAYQLALQEILNNPNENGLYSQQQYDDNYDKGFRDGVNSVPAGIDENGFKILFNSILNAPYNIFNGILNFELFGVNVFNLLSFVFTIAIIAFVVKLLLTK